MLWTNMETDEVAEMIRGNPKIQELIQEALGVGNPNLNRPSVQYATVLIRNLLTETSGENVREEFRSAFGAFHFDMEKVDWAQIAGRQIEKYYR
jgi:hypothetical protein